jgi:hypothetical protein
MATGHTGAAFSDIRARRAAMAGSRRRN